MEIGAVLGAAPRRAVIRENSDPDDIIVLLGGRTGRDGCGGATGSSKVHTEDRLKPVEQKYRKEMLRRKERFRDSLEEKKSAILLKNAMTLVQAVFPLQSENLPMV